MSPETFIASRLRFKGKMAVAATAISFFVIIVAVAISSGFRREIRAALSQISGDVILSNTHRDYFAIDNPIENADSLIISLSGIEGINQFRPVIYRTGIAQNAELIQAAIFKGSEDYTDSGHLRIPSKIADKLDLSPGDTLNTFFVDESVEQRSFIVGEVYDALIDSDDALIIFASLADMQELNQWSEAQVSALELIIEDRLRTRKILEEITEQAALSSSIAARSVCDNYAQLFDWLDLIDYNVIAILALMIVVAGFNMISGLLILLFRSVSTIGILKAMGMSNRSIAEVFVKVATRLAGIGMLIGNAAALLFCLIQSSTHLLQLDPKSYFVSFVPVSVNLPRILVADLISLALIVLLLLIPTVFISKVDPARSVEHH